VSPSNDPSAAQKAERESNEVTLSPKRKRYTPAFKLRIIAEADRCTAPGELGALLRREGIYFSTLADFRKQKARGDFDAKPTRTPQKAEDDPRLVQELAASQREVRRLRRELERATALLDLQKKVSEVLGLSREPLE